MAVSLPAEEENSFRVEGMAELVETADESSCWTRDKNADDDDDAEDDAGYRYCEVDDLRNHSAQNPHWHSCRPVYTTQWQPNTK